MSFCQPLFFPITAKHSILTAHDGQSRQFWWTSLGQVLCAGHASVTVRNSFSRVLKYEVNAFTHAIRIPGSSTVGLKLSSKDLLRVMVALFHGTGLEYLKLNGIRCLQRCCSKQLCATSNAKSPVF